MFNKINLQWLATPFVLMGSYMAYRTVRALFYDIGRDGVTPMYAEITANRCSFLCLSCGFLAVLIVYYFRPKADVVASLIPGPPGPPGPPGALESCLQENRQSM